MCCTKYFFRIGSILGVKKFANVVHRVSKFDRQGCHIRIYRVFCFATSMVQMMCVRVLHERILLRTPMFARSAIYKYMQAIGLRSSANGHKERHRGDSNPCGQSPMDFESISLAARTHCHLLKTSWPALTFQKALSSHSTWLRDRTLMLGMGSP